MTATPTAASAAPGRTVRILHTSDWHLGRQLGDLDRMEDFRKFLSWMLEVLRSREPDVLLISGDIFDTTMPASDAQRLYYDFLANASKAFSGRIIVTAGNHDSMRFLRSPEALLAAFRTEIAGNTPESEAFVLKDANGNPILGIAAVPYLREGDVRLSASGESDGERRKAWEDGVRAHYAAVHDRLLVLAGDKAPLIALGHFFVAGSAVASSASASDSVYVGSLRNVTAEAFGDGWVYVALGHIHRAQKVTKDGRVRYCGSPLALDFGDTKHPQVVLEVEISGKDVSVTEIPVPQPRKLERLEGSLAELSEGICELGKAFPGAAAEAICTEALTDAASAVRELSADAEAAGVYLAAVRMGTRAGGFSIDQPQRRLDDILPAEVFDSVLEQNGAADEERVWLRDLFGEALEEAQKRASEKKAAEAERLAAGEVLMAKKED